MFKVDHLYAPKSRIPISVTPGYFCSYFLVFLNSVLETKMKHIDILLLHLRKESYLDMFKNKIYSPISYKLHM